MGRLAELRTALLERSLDGLDRLAQRRGRSASLPAHLTTGLAGEDAALFYLRRKGYTVVARRWSSGDVPGDVDLIAWQGLMLCFIEVKTRTAHDMSPAETAIDTQKRNTLRRLARQYMRELPGEIVPQARFDVVSVYVLPGTAPESTYPSLISRNAAARSLLRYSRYFGSILGRARNS